LHTDALGRGSDTVIGRAICDQETFIVVRKICNIVNSRSCVLRHRMLVAAAAGDDIVAIYITHPMRRVEYAFGKLLTFLTRCCHTRFVRATAAAIDADWLLH